MEPFDYSRGIGGGMLLAGDYAAEDLRQRLGRLETEGLTLRNRATEQEMRALQVAADRQSMFDVDMRNVADNPTADGIAQLAIRYPEMTDKLAKSWGLMDSARQQADLRDMAQIYSSMRGGRPDLAAASLRERIAADRDADGMADPQDEAILADLESGDAQRVAAATARTGFLLAAVTGPEKFGSTYGTLTEASRPATVGPGSNIVDPNQIDPETGLAKVLYSAPFAPRPITVGEGETVYEYQPGAKGGDPASGVATALETNPGAIKDGPWARSQPGYTGSSGGFATFATRSQGEAAQTRLLRDNYIGKGFKTPRAVIEKYAPRGPENSDASVNNYTAYVARRLGIGPDDEVPASKLPLLARAIREFETGQGKQAGGPRVIAQGAPKQVEPDKPSNPSMTRSVNGKVYVKVDGRWYQQGGS